MKATNLTLSLIAALALLTAGPALAKKGERETHHAQMQYHFAGTVGKVHRKRNGEYLIFIGDRSYIFKGNSKLYGKNSRPESIRRLKKGDIVSVKLVTPEDLSKVILLQDIKEIHILDKHPGPIPAALPSDKGQNKGLKRR